VAGIAAESGTEAALELDAGASISSSYDCDLACIFELMRVRFAA
jgi:hypothetical protein